MISVVLEMLADVFEVGILVLGKVIIIFEFLILRLIEDNIDLRTLALLVLEREVLCCWKVLVQFGLEDGCIRFLDESEEDVAAA